jgi:hypothetical protein
MLCLILAKPGVQEFSAQSWRSQEYKNIMLNPGKARRAIKLCPILAKPGVQEIYAQSWRSQEYKNVNPGEA